MRLVEMHFWVATIGVVLYIAAMWMAGVMQGLMWRATNPDGTLTYTFVEALKQTYPFYYVRLTGGLLYLSGIRTVASPSRGPRAARRGAARWRRHPPRASR